MKKYKVIIKETNQVIGVECLDKNENYSWYYNEMQGNKLIRYEGKGRIVSNDYELDYILIKDDEKSPQGCNYDECKTCNCKTCWNCGGNGKIRESEMLYRPCGVCKGCGKIKTKQIKCPSCGSFDIGFHYVKDYNFCNVCNFEW